MASQPRPPAEVTIDAALVRALLGEQHPDLAHLPLADAGAGWDNQLFRLGDALAVRLPRRAVAAPLIVNEQQWLPTLAGHLTLPIPVPVRAGHPGCGFPWSWNVVPWLEGDSATAAPPVTELAAADLGRFVRQLHQPAPATAPRSHWRGVPLAERTSSLIEHVARLGDRIEGDRILAAWNEMLRTPPWSGPPLWLHGDLHPGNLLVRDGRLSAVIDFGDLTAGDPATDLSVAWLMLPPSGRGLFRAAASGTVDPVDDDTWGRARAWALCLGVSYLANSSDDPELAALSRATIAAVLDDEA